MANDFQSIREFDFGGGVDQESAENQIPEGHVEIARNVDANSEGYLTKRAGYEGFAGNLPFRVRTYQQLAGTNQICFTLDSSVNLSQVRNTPIIVRGKLPEAPGTGDFSTTDAVQYYPSSTTDIRYTLAGTGSLSIAAEDHVQDTPFLFVGLAESTSTTNFSNSKILPDAVAINKATQEITIDYVNGTSSFQGFVYWLGRDTSIGNAWQGSSSGEDTTINIPAAPGVQTFTIPAATHTLKNNLIGAKLFVDDGSTLNEIIPESVSIAPNGDVTLGVINDTGGALDVRALLSSVPDGNFASDTLPSGLTTTITVPNVGTEFNFVYCYFENLGTGNLEMVLPESVVYDDVNEQLEVTFINNTGSAANFFVYYEAADVSINEICVDANTAGITNFTSTEPQLTLWGLDHEGAYASGAGNRAGWVQHIDSYRAPGAEFVVAGIGGNFYEAGVADDYALSHLFPTLYPRLTERVQSSVILAPAFTGTSAPLTRTRGVLQADGGDEGYFVGQTITAETAGPNAGLIKYSFALTGDSLLDAASINNVISTTLGNEDQLTISQTCFSRNSGTFKIKAVSYVNGSGLLEIWVENPAYAGLALNTAPDYNETESAFRAAIFTDALEMQASTRFIRGDRLTGTGLGTGTFTVIGTSGNLVRINGVTSELNLAAGLRLIATRTGAVLPLRTAAGQAAVEGVVRGDMLALSGRASKLRVKDVNTQQDQVIAINSDVVTGATTSNLRVGDAVLFAQAGEYDGEFKVSAIIDETTFTIDTSVREVDSSVLGAIMVGNTVTVDDDATVLSDSPLNSITVSVPLRWVPIEAPTPSSPAYSQAKPAYTAHMDTALFSSQPAIRSVMVQDSMYMTNGEDEVLKYDGFQLTRAGLPRFQALQFLTVEQNGSGGIVVPSYTASGTTTENSRLITFGAGEVLGFNVGDRVNVSNNGTFTVSAIDIDTDRMFLDSAMSTSASETVSVTFQYRYYAKFRLVDQNNAIVASATTGSEDFVVDNVSTASIIRLRLLQPPAFQQYNYERIEVELYRTKANGNTYFRLLATPLTFRADDPYIDFEDQIPDSLLFDTELDPEISVLKGASLGPALQPPLRAKYVTSVNNRLVLANVKGYPTINLSYGASGSEVTLAELAGQTLTLQTDTTSQTFEWRDSSVAGTIVAGSGLFTVNTSGTYTAGQWVYITTGDEQLSVSGWHQVATGGTNTFTVSSQATISPVPTGVRVVTASISGAVPVYTGLDDANYGIRFGNSGSERQVGILRMVAAINSWARSLGSEAWAVAQGGGEYAGGQIVIEQPLASSESLSVLLSQTSDFRVFANGLTLNVASATAADRTAFAQTRLFPSRLVTSYPNYPEVFDNQQATNSAESDSAVDVNSADGQEITGIIPFFGDSAFGAAQKSDILVVFKTDSIYLVDLSIKAQGGDPVRKIESNGLGCTAPYSIAATRQGIMFANDSGIYRLTRNLTVEYVGRKIERLWSGREATVDLAQADLMMAHNWAAGRYYRLSYPVQGDSSNSGVFAYNHSREYSQRSGGLGSWTIYDNHPACGWANLDEDAYFASTRGRVFKLRSAGDDTDFRDDDQPIEAEVRLRALDFGSAAVRKLVRNILLHVRTPADVNSTELLAAVDLKNDFRQLDAFKIDVPDSLDGLSDTGFKKVATIKFSTYQSKFNYIQLLIRNLAKDEGMEVTHVAFRVAGLSPAGLTDAARTTGNS